MTHPEPSPRLRAFQKGSSSVQRGAVLVNLGRELTIQERETIDAVTARFSRLADILIQKVFRTLDQIEFTDEGTLIDRLNRMEKRGLISSAKDWVAIRQLRNDVAHEYLVDESDQVVHDSLARSAELIAAVDRLAEYRKIRLAPLVEGLS